MSKYRYRIIGIFLTILVLILDFKIIFGLGKNSFTLIGIGFWGFINFIIFQMTLVNDLPIIFKDKKTFIEYGTNLDPGYQLKNKYLIIIDHGLTLLIVLSCLIIAIGALVALISQISKWVM